MVHKFHSDVILQGKSSTEVNLIKLFAVLAFFFVLQTGKSKFMLNEASYLASGVVLLVTHLSTFLELFWKYLAVK